MQKYVVILVLWEEKGDPRVSFFAFPITCSSEHEKNINTIIEKQNDFATVENVFNISLSIEDFEAFKKIFDKFKASIPLSYDKIGVDFINCPAGTDPLQIIAAWAQTLEQAACHIPFSQNWLQAIFPS